MFTYKASTALVTGASKGLGAAFAEALAARGMNLIFVARSTGELNACPRASVPANTGGKRTILNVDLSDPESPQRIADEVQSRGIHVRRREHSEGFRSKMCGRLPRTLARSSGNLAVETISKGNCGSVSWDGNGKNGPPLSFEVVLFGPFTWVAIRTQSPVCKWIRRFERARRIWRLLVDDSHLGPALPEH
jgi:NAD(P)-dependent dehydrogenase (short-subunit alcohol dehydrogenase family)